jgi:hypothetical protein
LQHLSLLHIFFSSIHAMSVAPFLVSLNADATGNRQAPLSLYVRTYLESSSAVPFIGMSITSMLPLWPVLASYGAVVVFVAPGYNAALCREIQTLPWQQEIYAAAASAMQIVFDFGAMVFGTFPVRVHVPSPLQCELVMQGCQVSLRVFSSSTPLKITFV